MEMKLKRKQLQQDKAHLMKLQTIITTFCTALVVGFSPSSLRANGPAYYLDLNGSTPGFGDLNGTTNLSSAVWTTTPTGASATVALPTDAQLTLGYPGTVGISNDAININLNTGNSWSGLAMNVPCSVTLSGNGSYLNGGQIWTVPSGATLTESNKYASYNGMNFNFQSVTMQGGGTITFATALGFNDAPPAVITQNGPTVNLQVAAATGGGGWSELSAHCRHA
jgi:hypothetical protein